MEGLHFLTARLEVNSVATFAMLWVLNRLQSSGPSCSSCNVVRFHFDLETRNLVTDTVEYFKSIEGLLSTSILLLSVKIFYVLKMLYSKWTSVCNAHNILYENTYSNRTDCMFLCKIQYIHSDLYIICWRYWPKCFVYKWW